MNDMQKYMKNENDRILWIKNETIYLNSSLIVLLNLKIDSEKFIIIENSILLIRIEIFLANICLKKYFKIYKL